MVVHKSALESGRVIITCMEDLYSSSTALVGLIIVINCNKIWYSYINKWRLCLQYETQGLLHTYVSIHLALLDKSNLSEEGFMKAPLSYSATIRVCKPQTCIIGTFLKSSLKLKFNNRHCAPIRWSTSSPSSTATHRGILKCQWKSPRWTWYLMVIILRLRTCLEVGCNGKRQIAY